MTLSTIFPPVPKTVWRPGDADVECPTEEIRDGVLHVRAEAGLAMRAAHVPLTAGLYGVEFQLAPDGIDQEEDLVAAEVQVIGENGQILAGQTVTAGDLSASFGGMYQGIRLDVILRQAVQHVDFQVFSGGAAFQVRGVKVVPRPGQIWFPEEMDCKRSEWNIIPECSATSIRHARISTPTVSLDAGDHRLGIKLKPPDRMTSGVIASIHVSGMPIDASGGAMTQVIAADPAVTAEAMLANFGIPDAKLRFRLAETYRDVVVEVRAAVPRLTVQWVRLATADEAVWHHYYNLGGIRSVLGRPVGRFEAVGKSITGLQGSARQFESGQIYWTVEHGPCEVFGEIEEQYQALGGHGMELGFPTGRPQSSDGEIIQTFEGGVLKARK